MALINWGPEYMIGMKTVDGQHEKLVGYINQLHDAMLTGKGNEEIGQILTRLVEYTDSHFKFEERLFDLHKYSHDKEHRRLHTLLVEQVLDFKKKFDAGEAGLTNEVMDFLKNWLRNHILIEDKKYVGELTSKGAN